MEKLISALNKLKGRMNLKEWRKWTRNIFLLVLLFLFLFLAVRVMGWMLSFGLILILLGIFLFASQIRDKSIPYLGAFLQKEYFKTKFRISVMANVRNANMQMRADYANAANLCNYNGEKEGLKNNMESNEEVDLKWGIKYKRTRAIRVKLLFNRFYLKILYYLILISKNSREGFEILREEAQELDGKVVKVLVRKGGHEEEINIAEVTERIKQGHVEDVTILDRLLQELFKLHRKRQKKAAIISLTSLGIIVFATVINSLVTSMIFTKIGKSYAATYGWEQASWLGGKSADSANHASNQTGWSKYSSSGTLVIEDSGLELDKAGLVLHYTFDNQDVAGNTILDRSGYGNNGTFGDGATATTYPTTGAGGKLKEAFNFDGTNYGSYIDAGNDDSLNLTTAVTISVWIKPTPRVLSPRQQCQKIIGKFTPTGSDPWEYIAMDEYYDGVGRKIRFIVSNGTSLYAAGGWKAAITTSTIFDNQWWHIVGTWDKVSKKVKIYVNGAFEAMTDAEFESIGINDQHFLVGRFINENPPNQENNHYGGIMDDIRMYNRALSAVEVSTLYNYEIDKYALSQTDVSGTTVYGTVANDLTAVGSPSAAAGFNGAANGALQFNGTSQYLTQQVIDTNQGTITASMTEGAASINDDGQDFTSYAGAGGASKPYMIMATDSGDKKAWGYIGELDTGVKIYSTKNGSTQSWAKIDGGFASGSISNYEIRKTDFQVTGTVTIGGWVKTTATSQMAIISKYDYGNNQRGFSLEQGPTEQGNAIYMNVSQDGANAIYAKTAGYAINDGAWHHVVGVYSSPATIYIYIDGVQRGYSTVSTQYVVSIYDNFTSFVIGAEKNSGTPGMFFDGFLDEPFIYARALTADEVLARYNDQSKIKYASGGFVISSAFDTGNAQNMLGKLIWTETLSAGTDIKFQLRTSADGATWTSWQGPTGMTDYYTDPLGAETINASHQDKANDRWIQYKAYLVSDGEYTPNISDLSLVYGVNAAPQARNITASQASNGKVNISYEVLDPDTATGLPANQGHITPSFQYWNGTGWASCITMAAGDTNNKAVNADGSTWTAYIATWTPAADYAGHFLNNAAKILVTANDNELAYNTGSAESATFTLDTKAPVPAMHIDARQTPAVVNIATVDDSSLNMKLSFVEGGGEYVSLASPVSMTLETNPDTIYAVFSDPYGNTAGFSATTPEIPANLIYRDASNVETSEYQLFIAWKEIAEPPAGFKEYNIYAKENGGAYAQVDTVGSRTTNYYLHKNLNPESTYTYKITAQTQNNDISDFSSAVSGQPNGQGAGTDVVAPAITNVETADITTTQAAITWDTDEISSSTVRYMTDTGGDFLNAQRKLESGIKDNAGGYLGAHRVILTGLTPGLTYYYQVESSDLEGNIATSTQGVNGYTFSTLPGATVSNVTASEVSNNCATITWNTDVDSNSYVIYSSNVIPTGNPIGTDTLTESHAVRLTGLIQGTKYYYYVKSTDGSAHLAEDNNGGVYYNFSTIIDAQGPTISAISANGVTDTEALIVWTTDEPASSKVEYGLASGAYAALSELNANLDVSHGISLVDLAPSTKYFYRVISRDGNNNTSTSTEENFTTSEKLSAETQVKERETTARAEGVETGKRSVSGGGMVFIDKSDKNPPRISDIKAGNITSGEAKIAWNTDENALGFVEYGESSKYGKMAGHYTTTLSHLLDLSDLKAATPYHYKITSIDPSGNLAQSEDQSFTTLAKDQAEIKAEAEKNKAEQRTEMEAKKDKLFKEIDELVNAPNTSQADEEMFLRAASAAKNAMDILSRVSARVSVQTVENTLSQIDSLMQMADIVPAPMMSSEPKVLTTATTAIITWRTDKESNSLVAIAPDNAFQIAEHKENPYIQTVGNPNEKTKEHLVTIYELKPETIYHYQLRSQAVLGPMARSADFVFRTTSESLEISNYAVQNVSNEKAIFKWVTNLETDGQVKYIPYRDNKLMVEEVKEKQDKSMSIIHEIEVEDLEAGIIYNVELSSKDMKGQLITKEIPTYSTSKDDLPPIVYQVQTESAISPGREERIQTIISWLTNEPSTSRVYFAKGIAQKEEAFTEQTPLDKTFVKKHVIIITKFDPGSIYSFKVESIDSGGNTSMSKTYTILAPRQKESVFQVIMKNLEQTFGWVSKIKSP